MPCRRLLRLLPQLREELRPEGGVEYAIDEEVGGRVEDEAEEGDVLEDLDPEWEVEAVGVVPARQNDLNYQLYVDSIQYTGWSITSRTWVGLT